MNRFVTRRVAPALMLCALLINTGCGDDMPRQSDDDAVSLDVTEDGGNISITVGD